MERFIPRERCAVCGGADARVLLRKPFRDPAIWDFLSRYYRGRIAPEDLGDAPYEARRCARCGFLWQAWILDEAGMQKLYTRWISADESLDKKRHADIRLYAGYARQVQRIAELVPKAPHATRVLDYGMGWGFWCQMARAHGYDAVGFDLSPERAEFARDRGLRVVRDLAELGEVDFVNTEQVFEHLPDPRATLEALASHLAEGGVLRISVPDGSGMAEALARPDFRAEKDALHPLEHINCFTFETLVRFGESCGLRWIDPGRAAPRPPLRRRVRALARRLAGGPGPRPPGTSQCFRRESG